MHGPSHIAVEETLLLFHSKSQHIEGALDLLLITFVVSFFSILATIRNFTGLFVKTLYITDRYSIVTAHHWIHVLIIIVSLTVLL